MTPGKGPGSTTTVPEDSPSTANEKQIKKSIAILKDMKEGGIFDKEDVKEEGKVAYQQYLKPVAATLVMQVVTLRPCMYVPQHPHQNDAFLPGDVISELGEKGYQAITSSQGSLYVEREGEAIEGWAVHSCRQCHSFWFDQKLGLIVECQKCHKHWHQSHVQPSIRTDEIDMWTCPVCSGAETEVCHNCGEDWTLEDCEDPMDDDALLYCEGDVFTFLLCLCSVLLQFWQVLVGVCSINLTIHQLFFHVLMGIGFVLTVNLNCTQKKGITAPLNRRRSAVSAKRMRSR